MLLKIKKSTAMKRILIILIVLLTACQNEELDTPGTIKLNFLNGNEPISNADISIVKLRKAIRPNFEFGSVLDGTTGADGSIKVGPLEPGNYLFRITIGTHEFFTESFEILPGISDEKTLDIIKFYSNAQLEIEDFYENLTYESFSFLLVPDYIMPTEDEIIREVSIPGELSNGKVHFTDLLVGNYRLLIEANSQLYKGLSWFTIHRDFDIVENISLHRFFLFTKDWNVSQTSLLIDGSSSMNIIESIDWSLEECTFNFFDNSSQTVNYEYYASTNGQLNIKLFDSNLNRNDLLNIQSIVFTKEGNLELVYVDQNNSEYLVEFE